jgi:hypothetical protein
MEMKKPLIPRNVMNVNGKMAYSERDRCWNILRFKKEILYEFYQLKERRSNFSYNLVYYRTYEDLEKAIKQLKKAGGMALPFLVFLYKDAEVI